MRKSDRIWNGGQVPESESLLKPLSDLEAAIRSASAGDLALLMIAVSRREEELKGQMKILVSPYHRNWTIGQYEIALDTRHPSAYDVCKDNHQLCCCGYLTNAVESVLKDQGWDGAFDITPIAHVLADAMQAKADELVRRAIALKQMKQGE